METYDTSAPATNSSSPTTAKSSEDKERSPSPEFPILDLGNEESNEDSGYYDLTKNTKRVRGDPDSDEEADMEVDVVPDSEDELRLKTQKTRTGGHKKSRKSGREKYGGDESDEEMRKKRKRVQPRIQKSNGRGKGTNARVAMDQKKYSLPAIASNGGAGKVMFVFEKVTDSEFQGE